MHSLIDIRVFRLPAVLLLLFMSSGCVQMKTRNEQMAEDYFMPPRQNVIRLPRNENGAIYQEGMRVGLYSDTTARHVGDMLTIELTENFNASATSNTNSSKDNKVNMENPTLAGKPVTRDGVEILKNELKGEREFSGQGTSAMSSTFNGKVTATVIEVFPNGNLLVAGEKFMRLNQSDEYVRFTGIVRPNDISAENTVLSTRVANVHMAYSGQGSLSDANRMGSLGKYFQSTAWPY